MYNKIDNLRLNSSNSTNPYLAKNSASRNAILKEIKEYGNSNKDLNVKEKKIFSDKFYNMIEHFDEEVEQPSLKTVNSKLLSKHEKKMRR